MAKKSFIDEDLDVYRKRAYEAAERLDDRIHEAIINPPKLSKYDGFIKLFQIDES